MQGDEDDAVWRALGSPIRRRLLDLLREGPKTTGELAEQFVDLSRFAVMQHLGVLEEATLVVARKEGRQRFNHLNAVPLRTIYERWVGTFADKEAKRLLAVKRHVERKGN